MRPRVAVVSDRSLASADARMRRSALLYVELARSADVVAVTRVDAGTPAGDVALAPGLIERRVVRSAAETDWQQLARGRFGADGGDDALWFERVAALNPPFMAAVRAALDGAAAAVCVRPYAFAPLRALTGGTIVYDALELEYVERAASSVGAPNRVDVLERVAEIERACVTGANVVLARDAVAARLAAAMYGVPASRVVAGEPAFDAGIASPLAHAERASRKAATSLRDRTFALFVGTATPANVQDAAHLIGLAAALPEMLFLVAGRVGEVFPNVARPQNLQFTGAVDDATLATLLGAADVFVHPSTHRTRVARKVLDAAAHGAPLLLTPQAAAGRLNDGNDADVVPIAAFPERLRALVGDRSRGVRHARAARITLERAFPWSAAARPLLALVDARAPISVPA